MKVLLFFAFVSFGVAFGHSFIVPTYQEAWQKFKEDFEKVYEDVETELYRMELFIENHIKIQEHNEKHDRGEVSHRRALNHFGDMSVDEFRSYTTCLHVSDLRRMSQKSDRVFVDTNADPPRSLDWREKNAVTSVKNQGACGSCWAFATVAAVETPYFLKSNQLVDLSIQNLVDCDGNDSGCAGGDMAKGLEFVKQNGLNTEADYPYEALDGSCRMKKERAIAKVTNYTVYEGSTEQQMIQSLQGGALAVAVASNSNWQFYSGGIFSDCVNDDLDHGVTVVGYGTTSQGEDYWIIKNSWGPAWGEEGYMLYARGVEKCNLAQYVVSARF